MGLKDEERVERDEVDELRCKLHETRVVIIVKFPMVEVLEMQMKNGTWYVKSLVGCARFMIDMMRSGGSLD